MKKGPVLAKRGWHNNVKPLNPDINHTRWFLLVRFVKRALMAAWYTASNYDVLYYSAYMTLAVFGTFFHHFFFAFHLLDIVYRYQSL
jgi:inositol 1,4,5-triphosphate receptor type 1/inositol 1,4,5-triphosphate receptor type 3